MLARLSTTDLGWRDPSRRRSAHYHACLPSLVDVYLFVGRRFHAALRRHKRARLEPNSRPKGTLLGGYRYQAIRVFVVAALGPLHPRAPSPLPPLSPALQAREFVESAFTPCYYDTEPYDKNPL